MQQKAKQDFSILPAYSGKATDGEVRTSKEAQ